MRFSELWKRGKQQLVLNSQTLVFREKSISIYFRGAGTKAQKPETSQG